jgi:hypothetical protein
MVKNLNTIDRSERVRVGKHVPNEQAVNTIIINASSNVIDAPQEGFYVAPIRVNESIYSNVMCYDISTKEIVDTGKSIDLQGVSETGNSTTETIQFTNNTTSFVTTSNVGIANANPQHDLSVGGDVYIEGNLTVLGETTAISSENLRVKDAIVELGENNTDSDFVFDLGLIMTRPGSNVTASYIESSNEYIIGYTQNSASDTYITPDESNLIQMRVYGEVTANSFIGDGSFLSNVIQDTDLESNLTIIRDEMAANTLTLRDDLQSNATILRGEMAANTLTLRADLQSNISITESTLRSEMAANTVTLRADLQSNASILRGEMAANTLTLRDDLQSNATILRGEMAANTLTLRDDLQSNASILRGEMAANTLTLRDDLQSNATILRGEMAANTVTLRGDLQSNVSILRGEMAANTLTLRSDLQSNIGITESTLRSEMAANTVTLRNEIALKSNINNPVFTGIITGDGGAISNISLQHVTEYGDSTDRTITMSNALSLITSGNVGINTPTPQKMLHVAGEILADDDITGVDFYGDDATFTGALTVSGDTLIYGDLEVRGNTTHLSTQNLLVEDPILALGANNTSSSLDTGLIVLVYQGDSNVAFGYRGASNEFIISHTLSSPDDSELIPDTSNVINVHVYGNVTADYFIGDGGLLSNIASNLHEIALNGNITSETIILDGAETGLSVTNNVLVGGNVSISHALDVGSNVVIDDLADDVIVATGNVSISHALDVGSNVVIDDLADDVIVATGNVLVSHALDVGSNIIINDLATDAIDVTGNIRVSETLTSEDVSSNTVHANTYYGDGGILSNVTLQVVSDKGNTTSNTLQFTNPTTAFTTDLTSNVEVKLDQLSNVVITSPQADNLLVYDGSNWVNDYNLHNFIKVHNTTGSTLHRGNTVYIVDSFNNNVANVALAKSDSSSTMPAIGLIHEDIANGDEGVAVAYGKVNGIDTTGFVEGQTVYVSNVGAGLVMNSKPYGLNDQIQNVGICIRVHKNNGVIFVTGVGRSNDIPNAPISSSPNYVYVNETNNDMKKIAPSNLLTKLQTLEQVVNTGNTVSNSIEITGNLTVSQNVSIGGITANHFPIVGNDGYLKASTISVDNGATIIGSNLEVAGDIIVTGNSYVIESNTLTIEDRIIGIANNNPSHDLDTGIIMEHPGHNVALIHHGDEDRFSIGYTQNTTTDNHVLPDSNIFYLDILGNVVVQNNLTVGSGGSYFGDGTTLTGVALETDLSDNSARISTISTDLSDNSSRISAISTDLSDNSARISVISTDLSDNSARIGVLELQDLDDIVNIGNSTSNTILLTNADLGLKADGNIQANYFIGDGSGLDNIASNLEEIVNNGNVTSNTILLTNADLGLKADGNIQANYFIGDGSGLDNIASNLEEIVNNGNVTSNTILLTNADLGLKADGNIQANYFIGDGSGLDNIASNLEEIVNNGNVASNTILLTNVDLGLKADGNIQANYFIGDGSGLDNIASNLEEIVNNGNVTSNTILLTNADLGLKADGNIQATYFIGDGSRLDNIASNLEEIVNNGNVTSNTILLTNADLGLKADGNIQANYFIGDGSGLDNIASNLEEIVLNGNVTTQTIHIENVVSITTTGNVGIANTNPTCDLAVGSNVCFNDISSNILTVDGNILAHRITLDSIQIASVYALEYVTMEGNTTSNTVEFTNSVTGLVTTANVGVANSSPIHTLDVGSNLWVDETGSNVLYVNGNVHVDGSQLTTAGKVGIGNTAPGHDLSVASNLYVEDVGSNVLVVNGNASIGTTLTLGAIEITPAYNLEEVTGEGNVTSNVIQFTNSNVGAIVTGGLVVNDGSYKCKHYAYSNVSVPTDFANVAMTFASNVFHAKITAQLTHGNEEVSTMVLDVQGGTRDGTTSSLNIATGTGSVFGNTNTKPWSGAVSTTPTKVILEPSATGTTAYGVDVYIEYKSSSSDGKLESISIGTDTVKSFVY